MALAHPLDGVHLKLGRAKHHRDALEQQIEQFINANPYSFIVQENPQSPYYLIRSKINHTPPIEWSAIIGDFAHNARSALNLLVYQLSSLPIAERTFVQFPVYDTEAAYLKRKDHDLGGVCAKHRAMIERYQPYQRGNDFASDPLCILADINNADKHRVIQLVGAVAEVRVTFDGGNSGVSTSLALAGFRLEKVSSGVITEDHAPVATVIIPARAPVNTQPHVTVEILFGEGSVRAQGRPTMDTLALIVDRVEEVIRDFEAVFP